MMVMLMVTMVMKKIVSPFFEQREEKNGDEKIVSPFFEQREEKRMWKMQISFLKTF